MTGRQIHADLHRLQVGVPGIRWTGGSVSPTAGVDTKGERNIFFLAKVEPRFVECPTARTHYTALSALYNCCPALLEPRTPLHLSLLTPEVQTKGRSKPPSLTRSDISGQRADNVVAEPLGY